VNENNFLNDIIKTVETPKHIRLKTAFWGMQIFFTIFLLNFLVIPPFILVSASKKQVLP
jgi:hypothetical protein